MNHNRSSMYPNNSNNNNNRNNQYNNHNGNRVYKPGINHTRAEEHESRRYQRRRNNSFSNNDYRWGNNEDGNHYEN